MREREKGRKRERERQEERETGRKRERQEEREKERKKERERRRKREREREEKKEREREREGDREKERESAGMKEKDLQMGLFTVLKGSFSLSLSLCSLHSLIFTLQANFCCHSARYLRTPFSSSSAGYKPSQRMWALLAVVHLVAHFPTSSQHRRGNSQKALSPHLLAKRN